MFDKLRMPAVAMARRLMVREHELEQTGYFISLFFLVGVGIAIGRGTSHALFFKQYGIEYLPLTYLALGPVLMAASFVYAAYSDRMKPEELFRVLAGSFATILAVTWVFLELGTMTMIYPAYFLVFEVASEVLLMHFALYMSRNLDVLQAKRLSPLVFAGLQTGIIAGGILLIYGAASLGTKTMVLAWSLVLLATIPLTRWYHRRAGGTCLRRDGPGTGGSSKIFSAQLAVGLKFARSSELVRMIAMALFFMVISFYVLNYAVNLVYASTFKDADQLGAFFGALSALTSIIALVLQLFLSNRIIHRLGVARSNLIFPLTTLISFIVLLASFSFPAAVAGSINRESLLNAIRNPVRNLFFGALPVYMQGRARALCLAVVFPVALATTGLLLTLSAKGLGTLPFLLIGIVSATLYVFYSLRMSGAYNRQMLRTLRDSVYLPERGAIEVLGEGDVELINEISRGIATGSGEVRRGYIRLLLSASPAMAATLLVPRLAEFEPAVQDEIIRALSSREVPGLGEQLERLLESGDAHLGATVLRCFVDRGDRFQANRLAEAVKDPNPRVRASGIYGVLRFALEDRVADARVAWRALLRSPDSRENLAGLDMLSWLPDAGYQEEILALLKHPRTRIQSAALAALEVWPERQFAGLGESLDRLLDSPDAGIRERAVKCTGLLPYTERLSIVHHALEDEHPLVRTAAVAELVRDEQDVTGLLAAAVLENRFTPRTQAVLLAQLLLCNPPDSLIRRIVEVKSEEGHYLLGAYQWLRTQVVQVPGETANEMLQFVVRERLIQVVDLILLALEYIEDVDTINVIRSGLKSGDQRHRARAAEVLANITDQKLAQSISIIIDGLYVHKMNIEAGGRNDAHSWDALLHWCESRNDPWLLQCLNPAARQLGEVSA